MVLEKTLKSPLDYKIIPVNSTGNQSWIFIGRTDAEAEVPIFWPPDVKKWLIGKKKKTDAGKDWRQEEKGATEDELVGWHHPLHGHEFEQVLGVADGQGSLVCCRPWGHKESDMTEQLNLLNWTIQMKCPNIWNLQSFWPMEIEIHLASVQIAWSKFELYEKTYEMTWQTRWHAKISRLPKVFEAPGAGNTKETVWDGLAASQRYWICNKNISQNKPQKDLFVIHLLE